MFDRYTEKARRVIFYARIEAGEFGTSYIETEHLLLGFLKEYGAFAKFLTVPASAESIRKQIEDATMRGQKVPASLDMPLSSESFRVLAYAAEEANKLSHKWV